MMRPADDFELPVFDRPMEDPPSSMTYEQAVRACEEIIATFGLRDEPRPQGDIAEFKM